MTLLQKPPTSRKGQDVYEVHGEFEAGDTAASVLLSGFAVAVTDVFAAAEED